MIHSFIRGFLGLLGCLLVAGNSWAGWQRDAVCQGSCGGACGPCAPTYDRQDRAESAYDRKVDEYNRLMHGAHAAANAGDPAEAVRLGRQALAVLDDDGLRQNVTIWESRIFLDQARRATNMEEKITLVRRALAIYDFKEGREWLKEAEAGVEGMNLNEQGWSAFNSGNYALAESLFTQAQQIDPNPTYAKNVRLAAAKKNMKQKVSNLSESILQKEAAATATTSDLDFIPTVTADESTRSNTGAFGTTSNPSDPGLSERAAKPVVKVDSVAEELSSIAKSSEDAAKASNREEKKELSNCGFDGALCRDPEPVAPPPTPPSALSAVAELATHIPEGAQNDPAIANSLAWFEKLETRQAETQHKIDEIQAQIDSGAGDSAVLKARSATLANELKQNLTDQVEVKEQVKKRLIDLSLEWNEDPQPAQE